MKIIREITLDLARQGVQCTIPVTQNDVGSLVLRIHLRNGPQPITLEAGDQATIYLSNDSYEWVAVYTENSVHPNTLEYTLTGKATANVGEITATLQVATSKEFISAPEFAFVVKESKSTKSSVTSSEPWTAITNIKNQAEEYAITAENSKTAAAGSATAAAGSATAAAGSATAAAGSATDAANSAQEAKSAADNAKEAAKAQMQTELEEAKGYADSAENSATEAATSATAAAGSASAARESAAKAAQYAIPTVIDVPDGFSKNTVSMKGWYWTRASKEVFTDDSTDQKYFKLYLSKKVDSDEYLSDIPQANSTLTIYGCGEMLVSSVHVMVTGEDHENGRSIFYVGLPIEYHGLFSSLSRPNASNKLDYAVLNSGDPTFGDVELIVGSLGGGIGNEIHANATLGGGVNNHITGEGHMVGGENNRITEDSRSCLVTGEENTVRGTLGFSSEPFFEKNIDGYYTLDQLNRGGTFLMKVFGKGDDVSYGVTFSGVTFSDSDSVQAFVLDKQYSNDNSTGPIITTAAQETITLAAGSYEVCIYNCSCAFYSQGINSPCGVDVSGQTNTASADNVSIGGEQGVASHRNVKIHGLGLKSATSEQALFGSYNLPNSDDIFQIGNGTSDNSRANAFRVTRDGRVFLKDKEIIDPMQNKEMFVPANDHIKLSPGYYFLEAFCGAFKEQYFFAVTQRSIAREFKKVLFEDETMNIFFFKDTVYFNRQGESPGYYLCVRKIF